MHKKITVNPPFIKLEQFLKFASLAASGGEAKLLIQSGLVAVNGDMVTERGKKLFGGETVKITDPESESFTVVLKS